LSHKEGAYLGGVRSVEDLRARCRVDEDSECWHWTLSTFEGVPRVHYWAPDGKKRHDKGRRAAVTLATGKLPPAHHIAFAKAECKSIDCVNPDHCRTATKVEWGRHLTKIGAVKNLASKAAGSRKGWEKRGRKITPEMVREILHSEESNRTLGKKFGLSNYAIWSVRHRLSHRETMQNASVFSWRP